MFKKVLIANRGEIALRVQRTLRKLGVASVAVYSEADRSAPHVLEADEAYLLGPGPVDQSYLNWERLLEVIRESGAEAVHPGYGLLSENAGFARQVEAAGAVWLGPQPEAIEAFGLKHAARDLAERNNVPLCPGSDLLSSSDDLTEFSEKIGFPVMLKSTAGGGGIGMQVCHTEAVLLDSYDSVKRLAGANFGDAGVFLERYVEDARHIEVQIFGDGKGGITILGERDCSAQRRNQKVVEETPAPGISEETRQELFEAARKLGAAVNYRSAGTVEFLYDVKRELIYFLEVNCRLQVEHGVTELATGVDLVEWMVRLGAGESPAHEVTPKGAAMEVRIYAEDPGKNFLPSSGLITAVEFPEDARCDHWIAAGTEVSSFYDPLLAKLQVYGASRGEALEKMATALKSTTIAGLRTNLDYLRKIIGSGAFREGGITTRWLSTLGYRPRTVEVLKSGMMTTIQDWPGRVGYWDVGVPPSGPMDAVALRLVNRAVGNPEGMAALECTLNGPKLKFHAATTIALGGAHMAATLDGEELPWHRAIEVEAGQVLEMGTLVSPGCRTYVAIAGGFFVPDYLGSKSTFTLGQFGGHGGRPLLVGDQLEWGQKVGQAQDITVTGNYLTHDWEIAVTYGPHGSPDFFTDKDIEGILEADWEVHFNSARTGVRLIGPKPEWAREDGGEAGLHPSNLHDNAYAIGAVDFTGDMPVILGPDGPSLGGFVCPVTIIEAERWKMGQLKAGDRVRFRPVSLESARDHQRRVENWIERGGKYPELPSRHQESLFVRHTKVQGYEVAVRRQGDNYLLLEVGEMKLDLRLRFLVHLLYEWLREQNQNGISDLTPGIRSIQVHYEPDDITEAQVAKLLFEGLENLDPLENATVTSRLVKMPLSWDDPSTQLAIKRYMQGVNPKAPWCPSNIEFIRRINGLDSVEEVKKIVYEAVYLVMGLGDVYLGAPVATPLDPRHRLVTTKYNPARTWTPENAVGIGGAYLCIYGMEGPGGYQFVGRTVPIWNRFNTTPVFKPKVPWLLRFFDRLSWYEVSEEELGTLRREMITGEFLPEITEESFSLGDYLAFLEDESDSIAAFRAQQAEAFAAERQRWKDAGLDMDSVEEAEVETDEIELPAGCEFVESPMAGSVWQVHVEPGQETEPEQNLITLEAMKTEVEVPGVSHGKVRELLVEPGAMVTAGQPLLIVELT